jgi:hypothetical protein
VKETESRSNGDGDKSMPRWSNVKSTQVTTAGMRMFEEM